jgi:signal transduction histidine kinase
MSKKSVSAHAEIDHNLLAFIAHESRGPFNGLIGFSELLHSNQTILSPEQQETYTELVHQLAVKSFLQLQTLIVWVKLINNNLTIHPGIIDHNEWIQQVVASLQVDLTAKNIQVNTTSSSYNFKGDQQLLAIAMANLLYASLRYIGESSTIKVDNPTQNKSFSITVNYSEDFEGILSGIMNNPDHQNEQNFRVWIAYQIFKLNGIQVHTTKNIESSVLSLTFNLPS